MPEAETDVCVECGRSPQVDETWWIVYNDRGEVGAVTHYCLECGERELDEPSDEPDEGKEFWQRESGWILVRREGDGHLMPFNEETSSGMIIEDWVTPKLRSDG